MDEEITVRPELREAFATISTSRYRKCLAPGMSCPSEPIRAHSIPNAAVLELLAENGHVIAPRVRVKTTEQPSPEFSLVSRNKATTFSGFCKEHDDILFAEIEKRPMDFSNRWHLFLLSYRAITRQLYCDLEAVFKLTRLHEKKIELGIIPGGEPTPEFEDLIAHAVPAWKMYKFRAPFDRAMALRDLGAFFFKHRYFDGVAPTIAVSSAITSDLPGKYAPGGPLLILSIVPTMFGTHVVVCGHGPDRASQRAILAYLFEGKKKNVLRRLSVVVLKDCENFVIAPRFYAKLTEDEKRAASEFFVETMNRTGVVPRGIPCLFRHGHR